MIVYAGFAERMQAEFDEGGQGWTPVGVKLLRNKTNAIRAQRFVINVQGGFLQ